MDDDNTARWTSNAQKRRLAGRSAAIEAELDELDSMTVNEQVSDRMQDAAPDMYETIRSYLLRRLAHLNG